LPESLLMSLLRQSFNVCGILASLLIAASCEAQTGSGAPSTVLAKQGDAIVTLADIDAFAQGMPAAQRPGFFNSPKRLESLISTMLLQKQLATEARKLGLESDPTLKPQFDLAMEEALSKVRMQRYKSDVKVPDLDELAHEEYLGHKEKYASLGTLTVKHILISTKDRTEDAAKALADTVDKEVLAHPEQFDALIEKYSDDASKAQNHGVVAHADSSDYASPFADASKALKKPGDISPVTKTSFGFHVIRLVERKAAQPRSFEEVRSQIIAQLSSEYVEKQVKDHMDDLRNRPMDANAELVASLRDRYGNASLPADPASSKP
jgi:peptidyl-prolyl cis-trans isomerase C